jgi:hypothetical protein
MLEGIKASRDIRKTAQAQSYIHTDTVVPDHDRQGSLFRRIVKSPNVLCSWSAIGTTVPFPARESIKTYQPHVDKVVDDVSSSNSNPHLDPYTNKSSTSPRPLSSPPSTPSCKSTSPTTRPTALNGGAVQQTCAPSLCSSRVSVTASHPFVVSPSPCPAHSTVSNPLSHLREF